MNIYDSGRCLCVRECGGGDLGTRWVGWACGGFWMGRESWVGLLTEWRVDLVTEGGGRDG